MVRVVEWFLSMILGGLAFDGAASASTGFPCVSEIFADGFEPASGVPCTGEPRFVHRLPGSTQLALWTTPAVVPLLATSEPPAVERPTLILAAAAGESESVQLAVRKAPGGGSGTLDVGSLPFDRNDGIAAPTIAEVVGNELRPWSMVADFGAGDTLLLWITVDVPTDALPGLHRSELLIDGSGLAAVAVPVELYVFDVQLPSAASLPVMLHGSLGANTHDTKQRLFDSRLAPANAVLPSGFDAAVTWDQVAHPANRCLNFDDETDHELADFAAGALAQKYLLGIGWNDVGFSQSLFFQPLSELAPRPSTFCDQSIGPDPLGTAGYNQQWGAYLAALDAYLAGGGLRSHGFALLQSAVFGAADQDLAASLCTIADENAPLLPVGIRSAPDPAIAEHPSMACGFDVWISSLNALDTDYALGRQLMHGEQVWLDASSSLPPPFIDPGNPLATDSSARVAALLAWKTRSRGWYFGISGAFFDSFSRLTRQSALLREGLEDYEYLALWTGQAQPDPDVVHPADATVDSVVGSAVAHAHDPEAYAQFRYQLGRWLEGRAPQPPTYLAPVRAPRAAYFINFQDPTGQPLDSPLMVDGHTWEKAGWSTFDAGTGRGWFGQVSQSPAAARYGYDAGAGAFNSVQRSYLYFDLGTIHVLEIGLEPGRYRITVGAGRPTQSNPDPQHVGVEDVTLVDDELMSGQVERSADIDLVDGSLTLTLGGRRRQLGAIGYSFLSYLLIEPIAP